MARRKLGPRSRRVFASLLAAAMVGGCGGGDDGPRPYAQGDLAGTWDFAKLRVGTGHGWERGISSVDAGGAVTLLSFLDDAGRTDPGPQGSTVVAVDPGTGDLTARAGGAAAPFHGTLSRDKNVFAAVETPEAATYALMLARRRGAATYSDADIRGRTFALHALRIGGAGEWRYGTGSVDASGGVTLASVIGPQLFELAKPPPHGSTLTVDADGLVSDGAGFRGFLTPDKDLLVAVHPDPTAAPEQQLTILVFTGRTFARADLAGTWAANAFAGNVQPIWYHAGLTIGPTGSATYVPPFLDSTGATTLPPTVTIALAPDGTMTQGATNPSYRATLSASAATYVRTQTHNPPGRYGLGLAMRR